MTAPQPKESYIQKKIIAALTEHGCYVVKHHGGRFSSAGVPDLLVCYNGAFIAMEVKRQGQKPTALQSHNLDLIRTAGGVACVVTSVEEALHACRAATSQWRPQPPGCQTAGQSQ